MRTSAFSQVLLAGVTTLFSCAAMSADAASAKPVSTVASTTEQVVLPEVDRRAITLPRFPSNDIEVAVFVGTYATQNFGSSVVSGLKLGYHLTEDFFVQGAIAQTQVSDDAFRQILPGGVFPNAQENLSYYNLSIGYNVLPGEVFLGSKRAKPVALYVIGGVGSTSFNQQRKATFNFGSGLRVFFSDRYALQLDARDHIYSLDLLGKSQTTQNLELTVGFTASF